MTSQSMSDRPWLVIFSGPEEPTFSVATQGTYMEASQFARDLVQGTSLRYRITENEERA